MQGLLPLVEVVTRANYRDMSIIIDFNVKFWTKDSQVGYRACLSGVLRAAKEM
jgi:hypothetical protein